MTGTTLPRLRPLVKVPEPDAGTSVLIPGLSICVLIPGTPPADVGPNSRTNWRAKARHVAKVRDDACTATQAVVLDARLERDEVPFPPDAWLGLTFTIAWEKGRKRVDDDNLYGFVKAVRDGFADALGRSDARMRTVKVDQVRDAGGVGWVQIRAEVIDGA